MANSRNSRGASAGKIAGGGCAIVIVTIVIWWMSAQSPPTVNIPTPKMPSENAFDTFQRASTELLEGKKIDDCTYSPEEAKKAGVAVITASERARLMAENGKALATLRIGLEQPYVNPPCRSFYTLMPYYAKFRKLARFLSVNSKVEASKGNYDGAAQSSIDAIAMGAQIPHGSTMIGGLVGIACQAIGRRPMWEYVDHLNAKQALGAAHRLEVIRGREFGFARTLEEEKWAGQAGLQEVFRSKNPGDALPLLAGVPGQMPPPALANSVSSLFFMVYSKRRIMDDYTTYMDARVLRARQPYNSKQSPVPIPHDPIVEILAPVFEDVDLKSLDSHTQNDLLEITLLLRAYRVENGVYPDTLTQLIPKFATGLLTDPFMPAQAYRYKPSGKSYVLYSVGPDGKDDGGHMIDTGASSNSNKNERYFVKSESVGDIVAGKNLW